MPDTIQTSRVRAKDILTVARPIEHNHPSGITQICTSLCTRAGIDAAPKLYSTLLGENNNFSLVGHNALVFSEEILDYQLPLMQGLAAHKLGHLVLRHEDRSTKAIEMEADKFAQYLLRSPEGLQQHLAYKQEAIHRIKRGRGLSGHIMALAAQHFDSASYGSLPQRITNLDKPITAEQEQRFTDAIAAHNKRWHETAATEVTHVQDAGFAQRILQQKMDRGLASRSGEKN